MIEPILKYFPDITEHQRRQFASLHEAYAEWNARINVISRKDFGELYVRHVLHSLAIAAICRFDRGARILDVGCGGGFPSVPLAIMFPCAKFTLCDSVGKKITVASEVAKSLSLANVETVNARAETIPGKFDYVVSRAVTSLDKFIPWVKGRYTRGIAYLKGGDVVEEIAEMTGKFRIKPGSVHTWRINSWINDPYFDGKLVIFIDA